MTLDRERTAEFSGLRRAVVLFLGIWWSVGLVVDAVAEAYAAPPAGVVMAPAGAMTPEQMKQMAEAQRAAAQAGQPGQPPGQPGKPDDKDKKKSEGEGDKKDEGGGDTVKRPTKPPVPPDPRELKVTLDDKGRVPQFSFIGQPWPDVLQWFANLSKTTLEYQELPNDYLNLTSHPRSYTLDEVHDLLNQALHVRGFSSIKSGEYLSVFKLDKLDPAQVPQVSEEDLYNLKRYDVVKVSFELPLDMEVEKAKDDVKGVLSPSAKVVPLVTTRRLLIIDTVANLRTVSEVLNQERMVQDGRLVIRNFPLNHARPQHVIETLYVILGIDPKAKPAQTDPQQMQQQMQMMEQMRQQGRGGDAAKMVGQKEAPKVFLAYNRQLNSVMANAPPKEMKLIEQTIKLMDVPFGGIAAADAATGAFDNHRETKRYMLKTLDAKNFQTILEEIGGLSPFAELRIDKDSKTLFAIANAEDQEKINGLIDQFDGTGRKFKVIPLRLPADAVAATIYKLMAGQGQEEEEEEPRRYWDWYSRDDNKKKKDVVQGFGVDADVENNRLLLWANDEELKRIYELLAELGEMPTTERDMRPVRFIEPTVDVSPDLLKRIQEAWKASGGKELIINAPAPKPAEPENKEQKAEKEEAEPVPPANPTTDRAAGVQPSHRVAAHFAQLGAVADPNTKTGEAAAETEPDAATEAEVATAPAGGPQVTITVTPDGRLMLSSPDPAALDQMEELIASLTPREKRFTVIPIKYVKASEIWYDLTDYFEEDLKEESSGYIRDWYGFMQPKGTKDTRVGLGKRRKLMITWDTPSNSILVANASPSQLAEIRQLIETFDKKPRTDSVEMRRTQAIKVMYSKPSIIATAIKEVYRDLLSSKDKEFDRGEGQRQNRSSSERMTVINYGGGGGSNDDDSRQSPVKVGFDGALSLGADDVSGMLVVSAQRAIFDDIVQMVKELDLEAAPKTTVHVHRVNGNVTAEALFKALDQSVGKAWLGNRPEPTGSSASGSRSGDRDRDRDRDRGERRRSRDNDND